MSVYNSAKIIRQSLPLLVLLMMFEIFGGQLLNRNVDQLIAEPFYLILIPLINGIGGNIGSVLGARLCSGLHIGTIEPRLRGKALRENIIGSLLLAGITYTFFGAIFYIVSTSLRLTVIVILTGLVLTCIVILLSVVTALLSFKRGIDPDNVVIPVLTTSADVVGIACLVMVMVVIW